MDRAPDGGPPVITTIRVPIIAGEQTFIIESCLRARQPPGIPYGAWRAMYEPAIQNAVCHGESLVLVMDDVVVGFVVTVESHLFMLYVKLDFRGNGYGMQLLREALPHQARALEFITTADMLTPSWKAWCRAKGIKFTIAKETDHGQEDRAA